MKVLFITSSRIGDAVLSTGLLDHIVRTEPGARITVVCGRLPASLFEGLPGLDRVVALEKKKYHGHWLELWRQVAGVRWDVVVDLRDSAVSRLVLAKRRHIFSKRVRRAGHKTEQCAAVMGLDYTPAPVVWISDAQRRRAEDLIPAGEPVLGIGPAANWIGKTWPAERFIEIIHIVTGPGGVLPGARVAVFAAPGEEDAALPVLKAVPEDRRIDVIAKADPGTVAAALARCALYIGNDSGLMHCAAAAGTPTVGLFGPSYPEVYRPWGVHAVYVRTPERFEDLTAFPGYDPETLDRSLMFSLTTEAVAAAVESFYQSRRTPRRKA